MAMHTGFIMLRVTILDRKCMAPAERRSWCLSRNFNGIRHPDHSKKVLFTIPHKLILFIF